METVKNLPGIMLSASGKELNFNHFTTDMLSSWDICVSLSNICRWGGHIRQDFKVAQHTLLVWMLAPPTLKPMALIHDAAEGVMGFDLPKPIKLIMGPAYDLLEERVERAVYEYYDVDYDLKELIKPFDRKAGAIEQAYFRKGDIRPLSDMFRDLKYDGILTARESFLLLYDQYRDAFPGK